MGACPYPPAVPRSPAQQDNGVMDQDVQAYIDRIDPQHRPVFDRVHGLIGGVRNGHGAVLPDADYRAGGRRLHLGVWRHGVSLYGWPQGQDGGFVARHPALLVAKARSGSGHRTRRPFPMTSYQP